MGYAIFGARKLQLTSRISNLNFRIMALSQQQQSLSSVSMALQQCFSQLGLGMSGSFDGGPFGNIFKGGYENFINSFDGNKEMAASYMQGYSVYLQRQERELNQLSQRIMKPVQMQENQIEQERKRLETQVNAAQKELEKVEEAENKQIEKSAPKFA